MDGDENADGAKHVSNYGCGRLNIGRLSTEMVGNVI
jgi:hypothetical protein